MSVCVSVLRNARILRDDKLMSPIMIDKITLVDYWFKSLDTTCLEPTKQHFVLVLKAFDLTNELTR